MSGLLSGLRLRCFALALCCVWPLSQVAAQDEAAAPAPKPLYIFNMASITRALTNVGKMFETVERPDMIEVIAAFMASNLGDLGGVDREAPIGQMGFLDATVLPPSMKVVSYVPIKDQLDFMLTMQATGGTPVQISDGRYDIEYSGYTIPVQIAHGYAFMGQPGQEFPEFEFPNPRDVVGTLATRYDMAISLPISNVPEGIRNLFATVLTSQGAANLQQRDGEPDVVFQARKSEGEALIELAGLILKEGKELTIGLDVTEDIKKAAVEIQLVANSKSQFAGYLKQITGKQSSFGALFGENDPLRISFSWNAGKYEKQLLNGLVGRLQTRLMRSVPENAAFSVEGLAKSLYATIEKGHIDSLMKVTPNGEGQMVAYGGLKVTGGETLERSLREVMMLMSQGGANADIALDVHRHQNVSLHRISGALNRLGGAQQRRVYGEGAALYVGTGGSTVWFAYGQPSVLPLLNNAIDEVTFGTNPRPAGSSAPLNIVYHMKPWLAVPSGENQFAQRQRELAEQATEGGNDELSAEVQPLTDGIRVQVQIQEAFIRMLGLGLASIYDYSQQGG